MDKYISRIPLPNISRIQLYINQSRKTLAQIKDETGADYLLNGGVYSGTKAVMHLRADGYTWSEDPYHYFGYAWDTGADIGMELVPCGKANYINCVELIRQGAPNPKPQYNPDMGGARQRSAIGLIGDKLVLYCSTEPTTPERLRDELAAMGCDSALMLDGGGSSQCDFGGKRITSARKVHNLILVYLKHKEDEPTNKKYKVCLDPGHGVESPGKCAPDKSYYEHEFALDMGRRVKALLERHGVEVVMTRTDEHCPSGKADTADLNKRVAIANAAGVDLFVSLHSNAQGGSGWGSAQGYGIYTSAGPETAARNVCARKMLARAEEEGIGLWGGGLHHDIDLLVTRKTNAPAVLIEHGFHTSEAEVEKLKTSTYRAKLAEVDAKGILDFLGVAWGPESGGETTDTPASSWAAEAWQKATSKGIFDGTDPQGMLTREQAAVVLDRLKLI